MDDSTKEVCFYKRLASPNISTDLEGFENVYGPDRIIPSTNVTTTDPDGAVRLRSIETQASKLAPESIPGLLARVASNHPNQAALAYKRNLKEKGFYFITYREYLNLVRTVAKGFIKLGLERYHSVAIIGFNSPEWFISYLAAIHAGGFAAGIYTTNSPEACYYCLENSRTNIVVAESQNLVDKILKYSKDLPNLKKIIQYEGTPKANGVLSWRDLLNIGRTEDNAALDDVLKEIAINQCATIVYTSGTVGNPKPAMISHDNLIFESKIAAAACAPRPNELMVSYLPLSHIAAQILDVIIPINVAATVYFADKDALKGSLVKTLLEVRPTRFFGVPRVWEKMAEKIKTITAGAGPIKKMILNWAKGEGLKRHMNLMKGYDNPGIGYLLARAIIFSKVKQNLGFDRCRMFVTAAAPLSTDIKMYFASLDIPIMDVFGMTECSGAQSLNVPTAFRFESVGKTLPGSKTKVHLPDENNQGEICMYGRNVFMGYLNDRQKTDEAIDKEGWLHSGDIGKVDENGFVYITGRQKEIIITAGGENIPPVLIEDNVKVELPCLGYVVLIGDKRKYLTVLLTLSCEARPDTGEASEELTELTKKWLKDLGCPFNTIKEVIASGPDEKIIDAIQSGIDAANAKAISNAQKVQKFALLPHDFSMPTGEIGPTLKLKRNVVNTKYKDIIEELY